MLVAWTSGPLSKPEGLPGPAGSAGLLTDVSYTKSRQDANFDSRFWQGHQEIIGQPINGKSNMSFVKLYSLGTVLLSFLISYPNFSQQLPDNVECRYSSRRSEGSPR